MVTLGGDDHRPRREPDDLAFLQFAQKRVGADLDRIIKRVLLGQIPDDRQPYAILFANQLPRASFRIIVVTLTLIGIGLALFGADSIFIPFLLTLGLGLPPLAGILILSHFLVKTPARPQAGALAAICWLVGTLTGFAATRGAVTLTGLPVLDSIMVTALVFVLFRVASSPLAASQ